MDISSNRFLTGAPMLTKCSNPSCPVPFRYLEDGRLFRLESDLATRPSKCNRVKYFWLCHCCSTTMMLRLREDGRVVTDLHQSAFLGSLMVSLLRRQIEKGLLLRSVSSPCARAPRRS